MPDAHHHALLGFRVWTIADDGGLLSLAHQQLWQPGMNEAVCADRSWYKCLRRHHVPHRDCQCGFHAYHDYAEAERHAKSLRKSLGIDCLIGSVAGSGLVQVHHDGWRAEYCQLLALAEPHFDQLTSVFVAADLYEVPLLEHPRLANPGSYFGVEVATDRPADSKSVKERS